MRGFYYGDAVGPCVSLEITVNVIVDPDDLSLGGGKYESVVYVHV